MERGIRRCGSTILSVTVALGALGTSVVVMGVVAAAVVVVVVQEMIFDPNQPSGSEANMPGGEAPEEVKPKSDDKEKVKDHLPPSYEDTIHAESPAESSATPSSSGTKQDASTLVVKQELPIQHAHLPVIDESVQVTRDAPAQDDSEDWVTLEHSEAIDATAFIDEVTPLDDTKPQEATPLATVEQGGSEHLAADATEITLSTDDALPEDNSLNILPYPHRHTHTMSGTFGSDCSTLAEEDELPEVVHEKVFVPLLDVTPTSPQTEDISITQTPILVEPAMIFALPSPTSPSSPEPNTIPVPVFPQTNETISSQPPASSEATQATQAPLTETETPPQRPPSVTSHQSSIGGSIRRKFKNAFGTVTTPLSNSAAVAGRMRRKSVHRLKGVFVPPHAEGAPHASTSTEDVAGSSQDIKPVHRRATTDPSRSILRSAAGSQVQLPEGDATPEAKKEDERPKLRTRTMSMLRRKKSPPASVLGSTTTASSTNASTDVLPNSLSSSQTQTAPSTKPQEVETQKDDERPKMPLRTRTMSLSWKKSLKRLRRDGKDDKQ